ncbi:hypothetical protein B0H14DRAFT_3151630 [Mycena olivaceomarginata]|nr:hypothetical protein B0H14DRAFT_3151630 [Mycena olivaceomarginata]
MRIAHCLLHSRSVPIPSFVSLQKYSPLTFPPETQVSVVFLIPPQSATSRWRPLEWVQRMQRVYDETARVPARKAGQFSDIPRHSAISPSPLFRVGEPKPERGECGDYEPEANWRACAVPLETRFARVSFWGFLGRRRCGQGSARSGVAGSAGGVLLGGGHRTYKSSFREILRRRCPAESGRGGVDDVVRACGRASYSDDVMRGGGEWGVENLEYDGGLAAVACVGGARAYEGGERHHGWARIVVVCGGGARGVVFKAGDVSARGDIPRVRSLFFLGARADLGRKSQFLFW